MEVLKRAFSFNVTDTPDSRLGRNKPVKFVWQISYDNSSILQTPLFLVVAAAGRALQEHYSSLLLEQFLLRCN